MSDEIRAGAPELAGITRSYNLHYERVSPHSAARMWRAITDAGDVTRWMGYPARIDLRVGGDYFVDFQKDSPEGLEGIITAIDTERRIAVAWGLSVLEWTLTPADGSGCTYRFLHHGMPVRGIPDEEGVASGWHVWLDELDALLDGRTISKPASRDRFAALGPPYRAAIEKVIGPL